MFLRLCITILLLSVVIGNVFGASVAVDLVDTLSKLDNVTLADNSTKSLNVSDSSAAALKIRDVDVQLDKVGPVCQCTCTNVTDIDGVIKNAARLDISTDKASSNGSESRFLKVRDVGALQQKDQGFNLSVKLTVGNGTNLDNSTDKAGNGSGSDFTVRASLPPSLSMSPRDVDVELKSLNANVSDDLSTANSTLKSTSNSSDVTSVMEERGIEDMLPFDDALFGDVANISQITSLIFDFDTITNASQPSNTSSSMVERESDANMSNLDETDMDLEGLITLKDENSNSTASKVSNSSSELEKSESEVKSERGVVVVVT